MFQNILFLLGKQSIKSGILILFGSIILILFELIGLGSIPVFLAAITNPVSLSENLPIITNLFEVENLDFKSYTINFSLIIFFIFLIKNMYSMLFLYFQDLYYVSLRKKFSSNLLMRYLSFDYNFYLKNNSSILMRNIINETKVAVSFINYFFRLIKDLLLSIAILISLLLINHFVVLILITIFSFFLFIYFLLIKKILFSISKKLTDLRGLQIKYLNQIFNSIKLIFLRQNQKYFFQNFDTINSKEKNLSLISGFIPKIPRHFFEIISVASLIFVFLYFNYSSNYNLNDNLPTLTFFTLCFLRLIPTFNSLSECLSYLRSTSFQFNYIVNEHKHDNLKKVNLSSQKDELLNSEIPFKFINLTIKNLSFSYQTKKKIFENINLNINRNTNVCFMGESGVGKSTLADLIMGFQNPSSGNIFINSQNLKKNLSNWKKIIGYIPQEIYLEDSTIAENVAFGISKDKIDIKKLERALNLSQLKKFTDSLDKKIFSTVGEKGSMLSGGQIQRIGIARALYFDPEILIFDEATSALDEMTENKLIKEINKLKNMYTIITITHKNSVAKLCDEVYEIKDKKINKILK